MKKIIMVLSFILLVFVTTVDAKVRYFTSDGLYPIWNGFVFSETSQVFKQVERRGGSVFAGECTPYKFRQMFDNYNWFLGFDPGSYVNWIIMPDSSKAETTRAVLFPYYEKIVKQLIETSSWHINSSHKFIEYNKNYTVDSYTESFFIKSYKGILWRIEVSFKEDSLDNGKCKLSVSLSRLPSDICDGSSYEPHCVD